MRQKKPRSGDLGAAWRRGCRRIRLSTFRSSPWRTGCGRASRPDGGAPSLCILPTQGPRAWGYAPQLSAALRDASLDLLHVHGLWMFYSPAARAWARATRRPCVVSPHGMLDPSALRHSRFKKLIALWAYERRHLGDAGMRCVRRRPGRSTRWSPATAGCRLGEAGFPRMPGSFSVSVACIQRTASSVSCIAGVISAAGQTSPAATGTS
jgi:hypothetical protein